jgi:hypothetical protein
MKHASAPLASTTDERREPVTARLLDCVMALNGHSTEAVTGLTSATCWHRISRAGPDAAGRLPRHEDGLPAQRPAWLTNLVLRYASIASEPPFEPSPNPRPRRRALPAVRGRDG